MSKRVNEISQLDKYKVALNLACFYLPPSLEHIKIELENIQNYLERGQLLMNECVYCEGVADFIWLDGGWYVCAGCIKEGKTNTEGIAV